MTRRRGARRGRRKLRGRWKERKERLRAGPWLVAVGVKLEEKEVKRQDVKKGTKNEGVGESERKEKKKTSNKMECETKVRNETKVREG